VVVPAQPTILVVVVAEPGHPKAVELITLVGTAPTLTKAVTQIIVEEEGVITIRCMVLIINIINKVEVVDRI